MCTMFGGSGKKMWGSAIILALVVMAGNVKGQDLDAIFQNIEDGLHTMTPPAVLLQPTPAQKVEPCLTRDRQNGECVIYYQCNKNGTANTDGSNVIDIRVQDGPCSSYLDVCCLSPDIHIGPKDNPSPDVQRQGCGWRNPNGVGLLTTGDVEGESKFAEFPWMVAILRYEPVYTSQGRPSGQMMQVYVGGGSLIHPSVVLTTAHISGGGNLKARAGEWDTQTIKEPYPHQDRNVARVVAHKQFTSSNLYYDIALLILQQPMTLAPNVGIACLPPANLQPTPNTRCLASGWGKNLFGQGGAYQVILKKVEVPIVEKKVCERQLRSTRLGPYFKLHSTFICAGGEEGKDTCNGDGGSPLVCPIQSQPNRYMQSGMVAWGIGCGENNTPGVYVDIAGLRGWIDSNVAAAGYDTSVYNY